MRTRGSEGGGGGRKGSGSGESRWKEVVVM